MNFKKWLTEMAGTSAVFDPSQKSRDWNWWGAPGSTGVSPKEEPIDVNKQHKKKTKKQD